jgi:hypothetical protein
VNLRASPAAVVEGNPGTGVITCPAASARCRSNPTRKSSPSKLRRSQPDQHLTRPEPAVTLLDRTTAASNAEITPNRSTNSVTAAIPDTDVNAGSGAPTRTSSRPPRNYPPIGVLSGTDYVVANVIIPGQSDTYRHLTSVSPPYSRIRV